jgi:hypothetical protein
MAGNHTFSRSNMAGNHTFCLPIDVLPVPKPVPVPGLRLCPTCVSRGHMTQAHRHRNMHRSGTGSETGTCTGTGTGWVHAHAQAQTHFGLFTLHCTALQQLLNSHGKTQGFGRDISLGKPMAISCQTPWVFPGHLNPLGNPMAYAMGFPRGLKIAYFNLGRICYLTYKL